MSNKIKLLIVIIIFLIASQWLAVRMVYKHKLNGTPAVVLAGLYNLKAGTIDEIDQSYVISLSEYLKHREFVLEYIIKAGDPAMSESDADSMGWNRLIKNTWLNKLAEENDLSINDEEFDGPGKMTLLIGDAIHEFKGTFTKGYLEGEVAHIKPDGTIIKENWSYVSSLEANQPIRLIATLL
mgnify:CR=1 FL=1